MYVYVYVRIYTNCLNPSQFQTLSLIGRAEHLSTCTLSQLFLPSSAANRQPQSWPLVCVHECSVWYVPTISSFALSQPTNSAMWHYSIQPQGYIPKGIIWCDRNCVIHNHFKCISRMLLSFAKISKGVVKRRRYWKVVYSCFLVTSYQFLCVCYSVV